MNAKLDILMLFDYRVSRPRGYDFSEEFKSEECRVYRDVLKALRDLGHEVRLLSVKDDIRPLLEEVEHKRPDLVFNLADMFDKTSRFDKNIVSVLELLGLAYTGGSPENLFICNDKALSKKILNFHRIKVPHFRTFYRRSKIRRSRGKLSLPAVVKPLSEEASRGISLASVADSDEALYERVGFIHESMHMDAIAEEYVDGREFYVSILGVDRLKAFPLREIKFGEIPADDARIATYKAKWDDEYRRKWNIKNVFAGRLPEGWEKKITDTCKRAFRALGLRSYVRFDVRVTPEGHVYVIEANVNPSLERDDEFERSAGKAGISFETLISKIVEMAVKYR